MKNLLEYKKFLIVVFILEAILLILGIYGAMYDDGHASIVILIMAIFVLTVFNAVFFILLAIFKSNQTKFYLKLQGVLVIIFFVVTLILGYFNGSFENDYEYSEAEMEDIQKMATEREEVRKREEQKRIEEQRVQDSIQFGYH